MMSAPREQRRGERRLIEGEGKIERSPAGKGGTMNIKKGEESFGGREKGCCPLN